MTIQPGGEDLAAATAEEFELEAPESELVKFAVNHYTAHGYEGINDCLFAMLCDLTGRVIQLGLSLLGIHTIERM